MAYKERGAMVRIHTITNSSTALSGPTLLPVTSLNYPHNHKKQEGDRLAFTQIMTSSRHGGNDGFFSHIVRTDEYTHTGAAGLTSIGYHAGFERPLSQGLLVLISEMSCALVGSDGVGDVAIQTLTWSQYNDNAVDNSSLVEIS